MKYQMRTYYPFLFQQLNVALLLVFGFTSYSVAADKEVIWESGHNLFIKFHKDLMNPISREAQDEIINISILLTIRDFINNNYNFPLNDLDENQTLKLESQDVATICAKPKDL